ncbi:MAG: LURP-one-related family protein [Lagierella massiliensis]|nr:LURP-one-related family protein [Lagierella massiliensis]
MRKLYIKQEIFKIEDHYSIFDEHENEVYKVDEIFRFFDKHYEITNLQTGDIIKVDKVFPVFLPQFEITFPNGKTLTLKSEFKLFKKKINVLPLEEKIHIEGNFLDYEFSILKDEKVIGFIEKEVFRFSDTYSITVLDETYEELFIAMMITIDHIKDMEESSR